MNDELEELKRDAARYRFLRDLTCNHFTLSKNDGHAPGYVTLGEHMAHGPEWYERVPEETRARMVATDSDWQLQVYPLTPVSFTLRIGATLDEVVDEAMNQSGNKPGKEEK